jgi:hypothetical protein
MGELRRPSLKAKQSNASLEAYPVMAIEAAWRFGFSPRIRIPPRQIGLKLDGSDAGYRTRNRFGDCGSAETNDL